MESLSERHRTWVDAQPSLLRADGTEFDKSKITLYAYRHTYAQRHADAGVPVVSAIMKFPRLVGLAVT